MVLHDNNGKSKIARSHVFVERGALQHCVQEHLSVLCHQRNKVTDHREEQTQCVFSSSFQTRRASETKKGMAVDGLEQVSFFSDFVVRRYII
jgi:hypothetical protein